MSENCDICGRDDECEFMSSGCAPVTYWACRLCRDQGAENIDVAFTWLHLNGGPEGAPEYKARLISWLDGGYAGWPEIQAYYVTNRDELIASIEEDVVLVDIDIRPDADDRDG